MSTRILLADDDQDFLDVTAYGLRRVGFVRTQVRERPLKRARLRAAFGLIGERRHVGGPG